jgi:hypothetical protein
MDGTLTVTPAGAATIHTYTAPETSRTHILITSSALPSSTLRALRWRR